MSAARASSAVLFVSALVAPVLPAQNEDLPAPGDPVLRPLIESYSADRASLQRRYRAPMSERRQRRLRAFFEASRQRLQAIDFDSLTRDGKVDWILFGNHLDHELAALDHERRRDEELRELLPFAAAIVALVEAREDVEPVQAREAAGIVDELAETAVGLDRAAGEGRFDGTPAAIARRAASRLAELRAGLAEWYGFRDGYDPVFSWWLKAPYRRADRALQAYGKTLRARLAGEDGRRILGDPIGRQALLDELAHAMIPYGPEELVEIAEREFAWCETEMRRAAEDLGFDGDWKRALEHVKDRHVEPGEQPAMIKALAREAVAFLKARDLLTIPPLCEETWRMRMMSPERQRVNPYFTGGEVISVSFPTDSMEHRDKLMSMRGNNEHFARATVHHELIPGHHLQMFLMDRHHAWRRPFATPFWLEGWALYWELRLWDLGFARSPEDRVGMLFWRAHRCARIVFSLRYHLGEMTAEQAVDYLVERVGHERNNAEAEVRRSVQGAYGPLYQCAYMLGGLQIRALQRELVGGGRMTERAFHDAVLRENSIPIEMVRAALTGEGLRRDFRPGWRFYEHLRR